MSFGGFGTGAGAGGFGAKPATTAGFGVTPSTGAGTGAAAPASGGRGFGGFGTGATTTTATATTGGFGAAGATGFGAKPGFGAAPAAGGFGAGGGLGTGATAGGSSGFGSTATSGLGAGRGCGFGMTGGFGSTAVSAAPVAPTAQQYPYPGIKGPGNATSWTRDIDFSQVTEQVRFEALPQPLQQHLMELRSFMHAERDAAKRVYLYFNESDGTDPAAAVTASSATGSSAATASSSSYRKLLAQMAALKGGGNRAVDLVAVHCNQHEGQARRQLQRLEKLEANIRDYERHVWEPLLEQGLPSSLAGSGMHVRGGAYRPAASNGAASPFVSLVEELSRRMDHVSSALTELEATLVPPGHPLRGAGESGRHGHHNGSAIPNDAIAQINAALLYELNQLRDSSCVAAHLHSRTDIARKLFTRQYGQAEADVLFADTEQQRNGLALFRRASPSTYFDIPPLPQQPQLPAAALAAVTTTSGAAPITGFGAGTTSALGGGFGVTSGGGVFGAASTAGTAGAATTGGFGAPATAAVAPAGGGTVGGVGFGVAVGGTTSAPATGGFGAAPAAGLAPATGGFGAAPTAGGFGAASPSATIAPAATGAPPSAPSMGPAAPGAAPAAFNLGGGAAATGTGFGMAPGKSGAGDGGDRPSQRTR
ncbi:conserved hypothetical protein [Leishmania major strain Friedlin]|uniref:Uncharacterized protein n=1 Tax=Leishmania major TaxID=5664 RepID=E9ADT2_LEIMA|nr:conserved hypothetical protein [Leishmania major strain Friedlin]CAG9577810.1 hypothetical_protein_-_conserved [Leishmania major strain Friedlin]CBZ12411.1 conserved hypothetical protein [Leishmania major strain Friedlin]|eukprot:XP_003722154.1 conserved hypothetical protein [Leishmania major strain Friedlin]